MTSGRNGPITPFLKKLERCLLLGCQNAGFPDAVVKADWEAEHDAVVARIEEGPRFKAGRILVRGASPEFEAALLEKLVKKGEDEPAPIPREEYIFREILKGKGMPPDQVKKEAMDFFPAFKLAEKLKEANPSQNALEAGQEAEFQNTLAGLGVKRPNTSALAFWEPGEWVNCQPDFPNTARSSMYSIYAAEGRFFADFEVDLIRNEETGTMDLRATIKN